MNRYEEKKYFIIEKLKYLYFLVTSNLVNIICYFHFEFVYFSFIDNLILAFDQIFAVYKSLKVLINVPWWGGSKNCELQFIIIKNKIFYFIIYILYIYISVNFSRKKNWIK